MLSIIRTSVISIVDGDVPTYLMAVLRDMLYGYSSLTSQPLRVGILSSGVSPSLPRSLTFDR